MFKSLIYCFLLLLISGSAVFSQGTEGTPAWNVTLNSNTRAPSNITVQNRCKKKHDFEIRPENVPFLEITKTEVEVKGGKNSTVPVFFDTTNIAAGTHQGQVLVICKTCGSEPTCTQDREVLPVILTIPGAPAAPTTINTSTSGSTDPCEKLRMGCDDLLKTALAKEADADAKRNLANQARAAADKAEQDAKDAEQAASAAEALAVFPPPSGRGSVNGGQEYTTADSAYLEQMNAQVTADYQAGRISADEYQKQLNDNTIEKARVERIKNEAKLKKEAEEARKKADEARKAADKAKSDAAAAKRTADAAETEAAAARKAYEDCLKKADDECKRLKAVAEEQKKRDDEAQAQAEAEQKRIDAENARLAAEAQREADARARQIAQENAQREAADERFQRQRALQRELFRQMYELGFISGSEIDENQAVLGFLGPFSEKSAEQTVGEKRIPQIALDVINEMSLVRNPCGSNTLKQRAWEKLETMRNPRTGNPYSANEAQNVLTEMCRMLDRLGRRQDELRKIYEER
ncbi:MAG: hypothetical protein R2681_14380 [Pyrinomonadaceae bacterium]